MAGREHPKIYMLPHVTIGYSALQEWDPAGAAVPKSTWPHSPHRVSHCPLACLLRLLCSFSHILGLLPRMVRYLGCLCSSRCNIFLKHICTYWDAGAGLGLNREGQLAS